MNCRYYVVISGVLLLLWLGWCVIPLADDPEGAQRLLGFAALDALFLFLGVGGVILWALGRCSAGIVAADFTLPLAHFSALLAGPPYSWLINGVWSLYFLFAMWFAWRTQ